MVSAWASNNNMVLGQVKASEKSNEITAFPRFLELIAIKDCVVTIDAMGCQKDIAKAIIKQQADYILAAKDNQKQLYQDIEDEFFMKNVFLNDIQINSFRPTNNIQKSTNKWSAPNSNHTSIPIMQFGFL